MEKKGREEKGPAWPQNEGTEQPAGKRRGGPVKEGRAQGKKQSGDESEPENGAEFRGQENTEGEEARTSEDELPPPQFTSSLRRFSQPYSAMSRFGRVTGHSQTK